MNTKIVSVRIKNIRGFQDETIKLDMIPNKPSLLVAPNGSGKSSFAIAFKHLVGKKKLNIEEEDLYQCSSANAPEVYLTYEDGGVEHELCADTSKNEIVNRFSVAVINNPTKAATIKRRLDGFDASTSRLVIDPIVLESKIPEKKSISNNLGFGRGKVHLKRGVLPSINTLLQDNRLFLHFPIIPLSNTKRLFKKIDDVTATILSCSAPRKKVDEIRQDLEAKVLPTLQNIPQLQEIAKALKYVEDNEELNIYLKAMQLLLLYKTQKEAFMQNKTYAEYEDSKRAYIELFDSLKETWQKIRPKESKGKLIIEIPHADRLSNGERDIIVFLAMLEKARQSLNKPNNILIIDEIFDYLDDANLVAAQYYISSYITKMKELGNNIYPIILTHLNPSFYNNYAFKDMKVYYLIPLPNPQKSDLMLTLLRRRKEIGDAQENLISKYMLHFHNDYSRDLSEQLNEKLRGSGWDNVSKFKNYCFTQLNEYLDDKPFCPLAVCVMLREMIEEYCYNQLKTEEEKSQFLDEHSTKRKLKFGEERGCNVLELFFLLGLIYNNSLHCNDKTDLRQTLYSRLQSNTIRAMIKHVASITGHR